MASLVKPHSHPEPCWRLGQGKRAGSASKAAGLLTPPPCLRIPFFPSAVSTSLRTVLATSGSLMDLIGSRGKEEGSTSAMTLKREGDKKEVSLQTPRLGTPLDLSWGLKEALQGTDSSVGELSWRQPRNSRDHPEKRKATTWAEPTGS